MHSTAHPEDGRLRFEQGRYWEIPAAAAGAPPLEAGELRDVLADAVRIRLRSDVPVGTCLSGGIDSPSVAAMIVKFRDTAEAAQVRYQGVHAFVAEPEVDERSYVTALAERLCLEVSWVEVSAAGCRQEMDELLYRQEYPFLGPSVYAAALRLSPCRRTGAEGHARRAGRRRVVWRVRLGGAPGRGGDRPQPRLVCRRACRAGHRRPAIPPPAVVGPVDPTTEFAAAAKACRTLWGRRCGLRSEAFSLPALLRFADRNSMSFGVEARLPFLDHRLVEAATRLAPEDCIAGGQTKAVLRAAMRAPCRRRSSIAATRRLSPCPPGDGSRANSAATFARPPATRCGSSGTFPEEGSCSPPRWAETEGISYRRNAWRVLCLTRWYHRFF